MVYSSTSSTSHESAVQYWNHFLGELRATTFLLSTHLPRRRHEATRPSTVLVPAMMAR